MDSGRLLENNDHLLFQYALANSRITHASRLASDDLLLAPAPGTTHPRTTNLYTPRKYVMKNAGSGITKIDIRKALTLISK